MKILIAGDYCQKYRVDEAVRERRFGDLFDDVKPIIESADYSIVNLEFPIVLAPNDAQPILKCGPNLRGTIESVDAIKYAGFDCCTLANNHILDQGEKCCLDTKRELEKVGIDTVGVGKNLGDASKVLYKEIDGETLAVINCCEHEFSIATDNSAGANPLNPIQQYYKIKEAKSKANYVLVIVHGGHEHCQLPSPRMQETYRFFVDAGADVVVNHHQHCYSGYEVYKDRPIFYGLGNFCFDNVNKRNDIWNEGYMIGIQFKKEVPLEFSIHPYVQCCDLPGIRMIHSTEQFFSDMQHKNLIISDCNLLVEEINKYYDECSLNEMNLYNPYMKRILRKFYSWHLLPSAFCKKQLVRLWNHIECESHRDKHIYAISHFLSKNKI